MSTLHIHGLDKFNGTLRLVEKAMRLRPAVAFTDVYIQKKRLLLVNGTLTLAVNLSEPKYIGERREIVSVIDIPTPKKYRVLHES